MHANEPPEGPHQALAGEVLPVASQPNVKETNPVDTPYTGYANFYSPALPELFDRHEHARGPSTATPSPTT